MNDNETGPLKPYGGTRTGPDAVSYAQVERAARGLMKLGDRPTVRSVIKAMGKGSPNVVADCLRRFWKDTAAMGSGDPVALLRLPPELAEAAVAQWAQALRFAQQAVRHDDSAARAKLEELEREAGERIRSVELREKDWDIAARIRDAALADARSQLSHLIKQQSQDRGSIRERDAKIAALEEELFELRAFVAKLVERPPKARRRVRRNGPQRGNRSSKSSVTRRSPPRTSKKTSARTRRKTR